MSVFPNGADIHCHILSQIRQDSIAALPAVATLGNLLGWVLPLASVNSIESCKKHCHRETGVGPSHAILVSCK